ncbi:murein biosynthesis integral membrane protein MurJ [Caviibacter abscessus]|uniref:murein biosynthesis integral membrane protein MurJ n=1 Tax=Caviibacter abscessus TaxID=1766719 RepID=UPI00082CCCDF|nr:murein biosynthesis integral membrane protein MurJ [Caviibacter abscessus]
MFKSSFIVMGINTLSRILGLIREILIANLYGLTGATDAYFASSRISNFFTTLLGEGSLGTVFIPLYTEKKEKLGVDKANEFVYSIITLVFNFTVCISLLTIIFSRPILKYIIGFHNDSRMETANILLKIMASYLIFIALSGVLASFLNNYKKFFISTLTGVVFNLTIIIGTILSKFKGGIYTLAISFLISGILQFVIQVPSFIKIIKNVKLKIDFNDIYVKNFFKLMIPTLIGIFGYQINEIVDTNFASSLKIGTISAINYASRLYLLPVGIFAISLSVVIFPQLSSAVVKKNKKAELLLFTRGLNLLTFLIIPSVIGLFFYSKDIITLIFGSGKLGKEGIQITTEILKCYALGLVFFSTNHLLTRTHYVHKNRKLPVIASFVAIGLNILLDYLLYKKYTHIGLTLATSISAMLNYLILLTSIKIKYVDYNILKYLFFIVKSLIASFVCLFVSSYFSNIIIKLLVFSTVYFILWSYPLYKKKINIFD